MSRIHPSLLLAAGYACGAMLAASVSEDDRAVAAEVRHLEARALQLCGLRAEDVKTAAQGKRYRRALAKAAREPVPEKQAPC